MKLLSRFARVAGQGWLLPVSAAALLVGVAGCFPLFNEPGYELSLLVGLTLPSVTALSCALNGGGRETTPAQRLEAGLLRGLLVAAVALGVGLLQMVRTGACDPVVGIRQFALGGGAGTLLAGAWGALAGLVAPSGRHQRWWAALLALAGPGLGIAAAFYRFYSTPAVYFYDHFFGYFSGPLYDTVFDDSPLVTFRIGSLAWLVAVWIAVVHLELRSDGRAGWSWPRLPMALAQVATLAAALGLWWGSHALGHATTARSLRSELDRSLQLGRCEVVYPGAIPRSEAELLARQCVAHLDSISRYFEVSGPEAVTVYLFSSWRQKQRLVGAGTTYIAKPWRQEVFIQSGGFPHPVLRHELAHVVAGTFGRGPLWISGPLGGWIPDPGRIEGVAVAASPSAGSGLTLDEQARVQLELGKLPPLSRVFSLSFLGTSSVSAYSVAGAFVDWLGRTRGKSTLRAWYSGVPLEVCAGVGLKALEGEWKAHLLTIPVSAQALEAGRVRYSQASIFGRRCPRQVDRMLEAAEGQLASDPEGAEALLLQVGALDPEGYRAQLDRVRCQLSRGALPAASLDLAGLAQDSRRHPLERLEAEEMLADLEWLGGHTDTARERYQRVASLALRPSRLRTLELKSRDLSEVARTALAPLLFVGGGPVSSLEIGARLARWADLEPNSRYPRYLLGRQLMSQGRHAQARTGLQEAVSPRLEPWSPRFQREAARQWLLAECALRRTPDAGALEAPLAVWTAAKEGSSPVEQASLTRLLELCRGMPPGFPAKEREQTTGAPH